MTIAEFDLEKKWWNKRKETEFAWKVSAKDIAARNYNLDFKNPHVVDVVHRDPEELAREYEEISADLNKVRDKLKQELMLALGNQ